MKTSDPGIQFIEKNEGVRLKAYRDEVHVWTIGVGHTGKHVHEGMTITKDDADRLFSHDVEWAENAVNHYVSVRLDQNEFDALVDFTFNVGAGALHKSTLIRKLNEGDRVGAANEFKRWVHAGGHISEGLVARRERDKRLFLA